MKCKGCGMEVFSASGSCPYCGTKLNDSPYGGIQSVAAKESLLTEASENDVGVEVYDKNVNGVLEITTKLARGSGYLINYDGYAITNSHVVSLDNGKSCKNCTVKVAGESVSAKVMAMGTEIIGMQGTNSDLALIKLSEIPAHATPLKLGDSAEIRTGERIFVIGNSLGCGTCITSGIISDNNRQGQLMYDCPTNPGNSGGPVFNSDGLVIGTHVAGTPHNGSKAQGMNLAIPVKYVKQFLKKNNINV